MLLDRCDEKYHYSLQSINKIYMMIQYYRIQNFYLNLYNY